MAENHNFFNFTGWENILHSLPFNHKITHYKYGPPSRITPSPLLKKKKEKAQKVQILRNIFIVFKVYKDFFICYYFVFSTDWIANGNKIFQK